MTDKKFTLHVIAYGAPTSDTGYVPKFAISDADSLPWVLQEHEDGSKKAVHYTAGLHLSEQIAWFTGELDTDHITKELLDMEEQTMEREKLSSEAASQDFGWTQENVKDGAVADTIWWINMLAKEAKYKFGPKARSYARMSRLYVKLGAKSVKERVERFDEDHPEAASWAIMGGSTLLSIGYLWWAKWYSDRWMEKLAKTIKEAS